MTEEQSTEVGATQRIQANENADSPKQIGIMKENEQILKCRDDKSPVTLTIAQDDDGKGTSFQLGEASECSWAKKDEKFGSEKLRPRIEPWLTALFQSEHLALLVGSGLSHAIHRIATGESLPGMAPVKFTHFP